jgi:hypothetical protein
MQETQDTSLPPGSGNLVPSCATATGRAYPPRRIVQVAKAFGQSSVVQSICQPDFTPVMQAIVDRISSGLGSSCLPAAVQRSGGRIACEVVWELAPPGTPGASVDQCSDLAFLSPPGSGRPAMTAAGGEVCIVDQVRVIAGAAGSMPEAGQSGWYYDDYSPEAAAQCGAAAASARRIAVTPDATLPAGVIAYLDCAP